MSDPIPENETAILWAGWVFDILTSIGPAVDWWYRPNDFDDLTEWQTWVAEKSKTEPALDWFQNVLAASDAPWANHSHLAHRTDRRIVRAYRRLATKAFRRYEAGDGIEWLVVAAINSPDRFGSSPIDARLERLREQVETCAASPEIYAAYAVAVGDRARIRSRWRVPVDPDTSSYAHMPRSIRMKIATDALYGSLTVMYEHPRNFAARDLEQLRAVAPDDPAWQRKVDLAQLYKAKQIDDVPISDNAYVRRAYNVLSVDNLLSLARRAEDSSIMIAAFARYVALEEWSRAEDLLSELATALPEDADEITRFSNLSEPLSVRLSLIAIHVSGISTLIVGGEPDGDIALVLRNGTFTGPWRRDEDGYLSRKSNLPAEYGRAQFLQRDFEAWLRLPHTRAFYGMRGASVSWIGRKDRRRGYFRALPAVPSLIGSRPSQKTVPFERLIASEEIARLAGRNRLLHTASRQIIRWAAANTDSWLKRKLGDHELAAEALSRLLYLCRFESCGRYNNRPAQQRAFMILAGRMGDTEAAKRANGWHPSP